MVDFRLSLTQDGQRELLSAAFSLVLSARALPPPDEAPPGWCEFAVGYDEMQSLVSAIVSHLRSER